MATGAGEYRNLPEAASAIFLLLSDGRDGASWGSYCRAVWLLAEVALSDRIKATPKAHLKISQDDHEAF